MPNLARMTALLLAVLLLCPAFAAGPTDVTYYEIPLSAADMSAEKLSPLRNIILPTEAAAADLVVWTSAAQWFDANYYGPLLTIPNDPTRPAKMWSIRPSSPNPIGKYLQIAIDVDGKVKRYSIRPAAAIPAGANPQETATAPGTLTAQSQLMQGILGQNALNFLAEWGGWFEAGIPLMEWTEVSPTDARAVNFGGTGFVQLPLATPGADPYHISTWPQAYFPCFHPTTGRVVFFKIDEFIQKVPKKPFGGTVTSTGTTFSATDGQVGALARTLVQFSPGTPDEDLGKQINRVARALK